MKQKLEYINKGKGGYVIYKDKQSTLQFYFEYGGGNCVAIIFVPTTSEWPETTKRPIEDRIMILTFVAEQAVKDQVPTGFYKISEDFIDLFSRKSN